MCEGVFLFLQLFKLTTSNWFGHTVRAQRVHEVRGTSAWTDRSGAETASSNLVATTKNTPSHMCEGVFLFLQLFKLTTSNWFGHTVRAQTANSPQSP